MKIFLMSLIFSALIQINYVSAQQNTVDFIPPNLNLIGLAFDKTISKLKIGNISKDVISNVLNELEQKNETLNIARQYYTEELKSNQKKLKTLGDEPEKGKSEPQNIAKKRKELNSDADYYKAQIAQIDFLFTRIDEINTLILKIRNRQLLDNILTKQSSLFHPKEFWISLASFSKFVFNLIKTPLLWYQNLPENSQKIVLKNLFYLCLILSSLLACTYILKFYLLTKFNPPTAIFSSLLSFFANFLIPCSLSLCFLFWFNNNVPVDNHQIGILIQTSVTYILYYYLIKAIVISIFISNNNKTKIINFSDEKAKSISQSLIAAAFAICCVSFFQTLAKQINDNNSIIYSLTIFANAVKAFFISWIVRRIPNDKPLLIDDNEDNINENLSLSAKISLAVTAFMVIAFGISLFGYIRLSEYIINRFIISSTALSLLYILDRLLRSFIHWILQIRLWRQTFRLNKKFLQKCEFWFGLLLTPITWLLSSLLLLAIWGVSVDLLLTRLKNFLIGFNIGGIHISISSIGLGLIFFFFLLFLFNLLKNSFINGNLSKIEMDKGLKNSLISSINFLGFIISAIAAIAVMGGSLSSITIIAGALSFGVGLGLQNMVSNLAAGLTILWERPIKIGDWVVIDGWDGLVRKINMRSTEIETWDKSTVIVPNSAILSQSLINYTYSGLNGRICINVNIDYDNDINLAEKILLELAQNHADVLNEPKPTVQITNLGTNGPELILYCYTNDVFKKGSISSSLRQKIIIRFHEAGINISTPQKLFICQQST